jgi:thioredoxin reductase (NADPH)
MAEPLELLIVGAGPAGISAALWSRTMGLRARVLESGDRIGGQLHQIHFHPLEVPGVGAGDGPSIAATCERQLADARIEIRTQSEATALERTPGRGWRVPVRGGEAHEARVVLVATGLRRRRLGVPGEADFQDRGVSYSARRDRDRFAGTDVIVVGGGDGAFENALLLAEVGCRVTILARDEIRARRMFRDRVAAESRIDVVRDANVLRLEGDDRLRAVRYQHEGREVERPVAGIVIKIGRDPNTEWCSSLVRDPDGYVVTDERGRTSAAGVWVAGDVTRPRSLSVVTAYGAGALVLADIHAALRNS